MTRDSLEMSRKDFLTFALGVAAVGAGGLSTVASATTPQPSNASAIMRRKRPNILLILSDQEQSFVNLPEILPLPGHQRLLRQGVGFANHHVTTTPCGPSRSVIYTGLHTQETGIYTNPNQAPHPQLSPKLKTIGHMLREQGYFTAYKGKWHLSLFPERSETSIARPSLSSALEPYGFADFNFDGDHTGHTWTGFRQDHATAAAAIDALGRLKKLADEGTSWCLAVNFVNPHDIMFFDATGKQE